VSFFQDFVLLVLIPEEWSPHPFCYENLKTRWIFHLMYKVCYAQMAQKASSFFIYYRWKTPHLHVLLEGDNHRPFAVINCPNNSLLGFDTKIILPFSCFWFATLHAAFMYIWPIPWSHQLSFYLNPINCAEDRGGTFFSNTIINLPYIIQNPEDYHLSNTCHERLKI
jgi:hypothetical protein